MRDRFPGYYRRTEDELDDIWENGILVLDANVLLNLYRYSEGTREELLGVLRGAKDRLWIPYQVADEFHRNRQTVIMVQRDAYSAVRKSLSDARKNVENKMGQMHKDPGIVEAKALRKRAEEAFSGLIAEAQELESEAAIRSIEPTNDPDDDKIWQNVIQITEGRVGEGLSSEQLEGVLTQGPQRYESRIPPGYSDANKPGKPGDKQFGDLILWFEIINKARETQKPALLVTDDRKEDWWSESGEGTVPRPELVNELHKEAEVLFHMLKPLDFVKWAGPKVNQEISEEAAGEIAELRSLDESEEAADLVDVDLIDALFHPHYGQVLGAEDLMQDSEEAQRYIDADPDGMIRRAERLERLMKEDPGEYQRKVERLEHLNWEKEADPTKYIRRVERLLRKLNR